MFVREIYSQAMKAKGIDVDSIPLGKLIRDEDCQQGMAKIVDGNTVVHSPSGRTAKMGGLDGRHYRMDFEDGTRVTDPEMLTLTLYTADWSIK